MSDHDIALVTDRYLRRFGDPIDRGTDFVWPRDSFRWASTRLDLATARVGHGFRNAGLGLTRFSRATEQATNAIQRFVESVRRAA